MKRGLLSRKARPFSGTSFQSGRDIAGLVRVLILLRGYASIVLGIQSGKQSVHLLNETRRVGFDLYLFYECCDVLIHWEKLRHSSLTVNPLANKNARAPARAFVSVVTGRGETRNGKERRGMAWQSRNGVLRIARLCRG